MRSPHLRARSRRSGDRSFIRATSPDVELHGVRGEQTTRATVTDGRARRLLGGLPLAVGEALARVLEAEVRRVRDDGDVRVRREPRVEEEAVFARIARE